MRRARNKQDRHQRIPYPRYVPALSFDELGVLIAKAQAGDLAARHEIVKQYLPLAMSMANRYAHARKNYLDTVHECVLGICTAIDKYDPTRGTFTNYAKLWIKPFLLNFVMRNRTTPTAQSRAQRAVFYKLGKTSRDLTNELRRDPTHAEIATRIGVEPVHVTERIAALEPDLSLDAERVIANQQDGTECADEALDRLRRSRRITEVFAAFRAALPERERLVYDQRMLCEAPVPLREVGAQVNLSGERIRQIEAKLRKQLRAHVAGDRLLRESVGC